MSHISKFGLDNHGVINTAETHWNQGAERLYEDTVKLGLGVVSEGGALMVETGKYTGRSSNDKFLVDEDSSRDNIWWGPVNKPIATERFDAMRTKMLAYYQGRDLYVQDVYAGADPQFRLSVRVITDSPWHSLFARNMFIPVPQSEIAGFVPELTILHAPMMHSDPATDGVNSEAFIMMNFGQRMVLIGGTRYAGEIKKSVFSYLNYLLPERGVLPMHCSANIGDDGAASIFFGLSGTGKTTLSADGTRALIGDDEHGWSDNGIFNFEGGCYAKVINLSQEAEPEIYATTKRFGTVLENVVLDPNTRVPDFDDGSLAENSRASYPIDFIQNIVPEGRGGQPANVVMLTADAFGVLPPISRLSADQAMYHFLSGYTARVAGTERGVTEPQATFSTCFGAPFMPRHPSVYAKMLGERIAKTGAKCWLVNTGWSGGAYGTGSRMKISHTRAMVRAALDGRLAEVAELADPNFGLLVPSACPDVPNDVLQPRTTWQDKTAYDSMAGELRGRFEDNFKQFEQYVDDGVKKAGIYKAA
ncbi:MAG: phosphoenolpyruvate carboxykinase [Alphaproteobacteria bacterium]|nr:phosphoenolpyruvate carboxykinase [Alphaproteobacteria bacterium]